MITLNDSVSNLYLCPYCNVPLSYVNYHIVGMYNMAELHCACGKVFYGILPTGHGLFYKGMIECSTGILHSEFGRDNWFIDGLCRGYEKRNNHSFDFTIEELHPIKNHNIALLNTVDVCYGHSLFKLLNLQYYLDKFEIDIIVIVQKPLRWMVPDGVAQIWTVGIPFNKGADWSDWISESIRKRLNGVENCKLCVTVPQPDSSDFNIERFTKIRPFPMDQWDLSLKRPVVTYQWRTDRISYSKQLPGVLGKYHAIYKHFRPRWLSLPEVFMLERWVVKFATALKRLVPNIDFGVTGMGDTCAKFPQWIQDLRVDSHNVELTKKWCERWSISHVIVGCNGSSLVLPGAHAGAVINLSPVAAWEVCFGSFPYRETELSDTMFRYAVIPGTIKPNALAGIASSMLLDRGSVILHTSRKWTNHECIDAQGLSNERKRIYKLKCSVVTGKM